MKFISKNPCYFFFQFHSNLFRISLSRVLGASNNNSKVTSSGDVACVCHSVLRRRLADSTKWRTQATDPAPPGCWFSTARQLQVISFGDACTQADICCLVIGIGHSLIK